MVQQAACVQDDCALCMTIHRRETFEIFSSCSAPAMNEFIPVFATLPYHPDVAHKSAFEKCTIQVFECLNNQIRSPWNQLDAGP